MLCPRCGIRERYLNRGLCKLCRNEYTRKYLKEPEHRRKAYVRTRVNVLVNKGRLIRPEICSLCQTKCFVEAHHVDYNHWSHFVWLCKRCHSEEHSMPNPNRQYDRTHLSIDTAEERMIVHRDYLAHCLRWSHIAKFLMQRHRYKSAKVLEAGCGREMPLPRLFYSNRMSGIEYIGVDVNQLECPDMLKKAVHGGKMKVWLMSQTDAGTIKVNELPWRPNLIVSLEVFEHVAPRLALRMIRNLRLLADDGCTLFISTPCWDGISAAANHINEVTYSALAAMLAEAGWLVENVWGTFASQKDYYPLMNQEQRKLFDQLAEYWDSNVTSIMWAPLFPASSRNCIWQCTPSVEIPGELEKVSKPWGQHPDWSDL